MTREEWQRIKQIASDVWDLPERDRDAVIAQACAGDEELRRQVESLVRSAVDASQFLETPPLKDAFTEAMQNHSAIIGTAIGPYRIVRELGHGGMGSVYLADRVDGAFEQQVAIKFVAGGVLADVLARRFREERRILATLDHPNIARLLDGGTTADGVPYVVMEYVAGTPITEYCESHGLSIRARIELVQRLCAAVQYAHQRLIIHRDVKAGNVLVTPDGSPKLLDFGIATLAEPGPVPTAYTVLRAHTLESASPEQLRGDTVTIAVDIYALGLLLFELLTGENAYASARASEQELIHAICDVMPPAPSTLVPAGPRASARIDRDLDLIVLKTLRKEPDRRYQSVGQLADDLQRYLDGRPVLAAPDSARYRAAKFVRRHRAGVTAAGVAIVAVLAAAGVAAYETRVAVLERARAQQRFDDVRRLTNSFLFEFHDAIADLPGSLKARQLVIKRASEYLDRLAAEAQEDIALQREVAIANERLATVLGGGGVSNLGDLPGAQTRYARALEIRERLARRPRAAIADVEDLADLRGAFARFLAGIGELTKAESHAAEAAALLESSAHATNVAGDHAGRLASAYHTLGYVQARRDENDAALHSFEQAASWAKRQLDTRPGDLNEIARLSRIQSEHGAQLSTAGRFADALNTLREAQASNERLLDDDPLNVRHRLNMVRIFNAEGDALRGMGDYAGAVGAFTHAVTIAEGLRAAGPDDHGNNAAALISHRLLGEAFVLAGQTAAGEASLRKAIAQGESITRAQPEDGWSMDELATAKLYLGESLLARKHSSAEGCRQIGEGLRLWNVLAARAEIPAESAKHRDRFERQWVACQRRGVS